MCANDERVMITESKKEIFTIFASFFKLYCQLLDNKWLSFINLFFLISDYFNGSRFNGYYFNRAIVTAIAFLNFYLFHSINILLSIIWYSNPYTSPK